MTLRLYVDHDSTRNALVKALRESDVDVLTALEASMAEADDASQLELAARQGRVLYSFNVGDYMRLHGDWMARETSHAGIVLSKQLRYSVGEELRRLLRVLRSHSAGYMRNRVVFLSNW